MPEKVLGSGCEAISHHCCLSSSGGTLPQLPQVQRVLQLVSVVKYAATGATPRQEMSDMSAGIMVHVTASGLPAETASKHQDVFPDTGVTFPSGQQCWMAKHRAAGIRIGHDCRLESRLQFTLQSPALELDDEG
eukprot:scpid46881/ scgid6686/ 